MKNIMKQIKFQIENLQSSLSDMISDAIEIQNIVNEPVGAVDIDDEELETELKQLMENKEEHWPEVPLQTPPRKQSEEEEDNTSDRTRLLKADIAYH